MRLLFFIAGLFAFSTMSHAQDSWLVTDRPMCGELPVECQVQRTEIELRVDGAVTRYELEYSENWGTLVFGDDKCGRPVIMLMSLAGIEPQVLVARARWGNVEKLTEWSDWSPVLRIPGCSLRVVFDGT